MISWRTQWVFRGWVAQVSLKECGLSPKGSIRMKPSSKQLPLHSFFLRPLCLIWSQLGLDPVSQNSIQNDSHWLYNLTRAEGFYLTTLIPGTQQLKSCWAVMTPSLGGLGCRAVLPHPLGYGHQWHPARPGATSYMCDHCQPMTSPLFVIGTLDPRRREG